MIAEALASAWNTLRVPPMSIALSVWDFVLLAVATAMGTAMAYIPSPRWKALVLSLPFPFTVASLSLGAPVGAGHSLGLVVLLVYTHLVRWLHYGLKLPIVAAIAASALTYVGLGIALNRVVPQTPFAFWLFLASALALGLLAAALLAHREEPAHRSPLPVAVKVLTIAAVVAMLVLLKRALGGFMTIFPLVGIVGAYEARKSLRTLGRQISVNMVTLAPMVGLMWVLQQHTGASVAASLAAGWVLLLCLLVPLILIQNRGLRRAPPVDARAGTAYTVQGGARQSFGPTEGNRIMEDIKSKVRDRYGAAASDSRCCSENASPSCCCGDDSHSSTPLGCGIPLRHAALQPGETVLDLGSGPGLEVLAAAQQVGPSGRVIGVDMTPEMVERARQTAAAKGAGNVEFLLGDIESLPLPEQSVDVIISNCVINLAPDKAAVFREMFRVLRPGGRFSVSDMVTHGSVPPSLRKDMDLWAECVAGAVEERVYLDLVRQAGFQEVVVSDQVKYGELPGERPGEASGCTLWSVTVTAVRPKSPGA